MSRIFDADKIAAQLMRNAGGYADFMADPNGTYEWDGGHVASYEAAKLVEDLTAEVTRLRAVIAEAVADAMRAEEISAEYSIDFECGAIIQSSHTLAILAQASQTGEGEGQ